MGDKVELHYEPSDPTNFYVDKATGKTRMIEYVPTLDVKEESGSFDLFEYVKPRN